MELHNHPDAENIYFYVRTSAEIQKYKDMIDLEVVRREIAAERDRILRDSVANHLTTVMSVLIVPVILFDAAFAWAKWQFLTSGECEALFARWVLFSIFAYGLKQLHNEVSQFKVHSQMYTITIERAPAAVISEHTLNRRGRFEHKRIYAIKFRGLATTESRGFSYLF